MEFKYNAVQTWDCDIVSTLAAGTAFIRLNDQPCDEVTIVNETGAALDVSGAYVEAAPTKFVTVAASSGITIPVAGNAKEIAVRRNDQSATQSTVRYIWRKYKR